MTYKLLIVDDEEIERRAIEYIVNKNNDKISQINQAANGQEAVANASLYEPDIIIMDINMPGLNGIKATSVIKKFLPDVHVIFLTAFDEFNYAKEAIKLGADDFVVKPASPETLNKAINHSIQEIEEKNDKEKQYEKMEEKLEEASEYLKERFLEAMVAGEIDAKNANKYLAFINIDVQFSYAIVVSMSFEKEHRLIGPNLEIKKQKIRAKLINKFSKYTKKYIMYMHKNYIYIFVYDTSHEQIYNGQTQLRQAIVETSEIAAKEYRTFIDFGIGDVFDSIGLMWRSFSQAKTCAKKKVEDVAYNYSNELINQLGNDIIKNDKNLIRKRINDIQSTFIKENEPVEEYRIRLLEFSILLKQIVIEKIDRPISIDENLYVMATKVSTIDEGMDYLTFYTHELCETCSRADKDKNSIIIDDMISYISTHISENITLEQLSDKSGLSTFYLSKLFKKHLNMNFSDYLTFIRMKMAKRLLKNPYLSVKEISCRTGYADPNYFTRVFKKEMSVSPTRYRKQYVTVDFQED